MTSDDIKPLNPHCYATMSREQLIKYWQETPACQRAFKTAELFCRYWGKQPEIKNVEKAL